MVCNNKIVYPVNFVANIETKLKLQNMLDDLGQLGRDEKKVLIIFSLAAGPGCSEHCLIIFMFFQV